LQYSILIFAKFLVSALYEHIVIEQCDNRDFLLHFSVAWTLHNVGIVLEIATDMPLPVTVFSSWHQICLPFLWDPQFRTAAEAGLASLPQLIPLVTKAPNELTKKCVGETSGFLFNLLPNSPKEIIANVREKTVHPRRKVLG
jgi:hypothetical protein